MSERITVLAIKADHVRRKIIPCVERIPVETDAQLEAMYRIIGCGTVDCVRIRIEGKDYDAWCDDEGLFARPLVPTVWKPPREEGAPPLILCGSVIFATSDSEGRTTGLELEDIRAISAYVLRTWPVMIRWLKEHANVSCG